jgi:hypothetical protein
MQSTTRSKSAAVADDSENVLLRVLGVTRPDPLLEPVRKDVRGASADGVRINGHAEESL